MKLDIVTFTKLPGPRYITEGKNSGQEFREKFLLPNFNSARSRGQKLVVVLDGVRFGYPTSFLEEAFGGLARQLGAEAVLQGLDFVSEDEPLLPREIQSYIRDADKTSRQRAGR